MNAVLERIASGEVILLVLVILVLELVVLGRRHRRTGRGMPPAELLANTVAGGGLALATGAALAELGPIAVALCLLVSAAGHVFFLVLRDRVR